MQKLKEAVIVEGNYDKHKLSQIIDAVIITTDGFSIFKNSEKMALIRQYAAERGIVILTDSDSAGFIIRNYLKQSVDPSFIKNAYIPEIPGKEKRKKIAAKEGILGVEGIQSKIILEALVKAGCVFDELTPQKSGKRIEKADLYEDGLVGKNNSLQFRKEFCGLLKLPSKISTNGLLDALNAFYEYDDYKETVKKIKK